MNKQVVIIGAVLVVLGIILGAFGAHGLEKLVDSNALLSYETGVRYQMYHGFALIILGVNADKLLGSSKWIVRLMLAGVILFSISIYFLVLQEPLGVSFKFLGPVTPIGGVVMITGWIALIKNLLTQSDSRL